MAPLLPINKKEFYIDLHESRYYFPGDVLKGTVVLNLAKPTKTNHIRITLTGTVQADGSTAQVLHTSLCLATSPLNDGKPHWLEAQTHRLPFEFTLSNDDDSNLPSALKLSSSMGVKYVITAVHDRPYVPERLCSIIKKEIRVLERIDITQPKYGARAYVSKDVRVFGGLPSCSDKVHLSLTLPQYAVVRGDVLPMEIHIKHYRKLARVDGIKVYLIRRVYTGKERKKSERKSITSNTLAIDLTPHGNFEQKISTKLLVPTNTPPTLSQTGRILAVEYAARVVININDSYSIYRKNNVKLESHVVIGTYPKPNLSIDDDDDDDDDSDNVVEVPEGSEDIGGSDDDDDDDNDQEDEEEELADNNTKSSPARIFEPPVMRPSSSTNTSSSTQKQQRSPRYSPAQQQSSSSSSSLTVVDPTTTTSPIASQKPLPSSPPLPPKQYQRPVQQSSSSSLTVVDPTVPPKQYSRLQQHSSSSPSLTIVDPTTPPISAQQLQQRQSSASSSPSMTVVDPTVPPKQYQRPLLQQQQRQSSTSSVTVVDPTTPPISQQQRQSSSPSLTVVDPTVPPKQYQSSSSSSSSVTVIDPTAPTVSIHTGRRHSFLPHQPSSSAIVIDPTTTTHDPRRHSLQQQQQQGGTANIIDPTTHHLHRNESTLSYTTTSSSSSGGSSSHSSVLVEPPPTRYDLIMKPDRNNHALPSVFTPTSPQQHPIMMASMPDIAAYVPSKGQQQKKRPPLHLNPIASVSLYPVPSSPAAATSPGGFIVPMPTHTPSLPPPLPPRRPSSQHPPPPPPPYYHYHHHQPPYPSYPPTSPWS